MSARERIDRDGDAARGATAIIAVHGVGTPTPGQTARAVADLFACEGHLGAMQEISLRIPEALPASMHAGVRAGGAHEAVDLRAAARHLGPLCEQPCAAEPTAYATVRLETMLAGDQPPLHVYELYWADLSKKQRSAPIAILVQIVTLPAHLLRLVARILEVRGGPPWHSHVFAIFSYLLGVLVPIGNLLFLAIQTSAVPGKLAPPAQACAFELLPAFTVAIGAALVTYRAKNVSARGTAAAVIGTGLLTVLVAHFARSAISEVAVSAALSVEIFALAWALGLVLVRQLASARRGASWTWSFACLTAAVIAGGRLASGAPASIDLGMCANGAGPAFGAATLLAADVALAALAGVWLAILATCAPFLIAMVSVRGQGEAKARSAWTCALAASASLVPWQLSQGALIAVMDGDAFQKATCARFPTDAHSHFGALCHAVVRFASYGVPLSSIAFALLATVVLGFALVPSLLYELNIRKSSVDGAEPLGRWLTNGLSVASLLRPAALLFAIPVPLVFGPALLLSFSADAGALLSLSQTLWGATSAGVISLLPLLMRSRFSFGAAWPALAILFDLDAYLREDTVGPSPRARMLQRTYSLLDHVLAWTDARGVPYERVVLLSHSQGTVIVSDALRARAAFDTEACPERLELVTMGCPLRALYARLLPQAYAWLDETTGPWSGPTAKTLGVRHWLNLFRSGDYIGRELWTRGAPEYVGNTVISEDGWRQVCLGSGAHMGYWRDAAVREHVTAVLVHREANGVATRSARSTGATGATGVPLTTG